jgi:hypothetical protein
MTNKPHMPTVGAAVLIVVVIVVLYHFGFHKR